MQNQELDFLSAVERAAMVRARKVSPVEIMRATLAQIGRLNPALGMNNGKRFHLMS
ncbi:MAG: hypothetical protein IAG10_15475 [Planctomycetaceae bacterium]|nr:hypothetical protein [Planctomycetaceae bacterium]